MSERYSIRDLLTSRAGQRSYHIAAEQHVRIEFRNMRAGEAIEPFSYSGDVVITCYRGAFTVTLAGERADRLSELDQIVISAGTKVQVECSGDGTVQIIWSPAQASTAKG